MADTGKGGSGSFVSFLKLLPPIPNTNVGKDPIQVSSQLINTKKPTVYNFVVYREVYNEIKMQ